MATTPSLRIAAALGNFSVSTLYVLITLRSLEDIRAVTPHSHRSHLCPTVRTLPVFSLAWDIDGIGSSVSSES